MSNPLTILPIVSGYRPIRDGKNYNPFFASPDYSDRIIIRDGVVEQTVDLMKKVVWRYKDDTQRISPYLKGKTLEDTCRNTWNFLYNHIQYRMDKKGLEQLRRPNRSWAERGQGIDCDCFSIFVSSILINLAIPHTFRIAKYDEDFFQHVYVIVPEDREPDKYVIDCVLSEFNYEKPYTQKIDFAMSLNGINVAVLSGPTPNVMDLVNDLEGFENLGADSEQARLQAIYAHLVNTRNIITGRPDLIQKVDYPPAFLKMLDYAIENWNTPNRDNALAILAQNEDAWNQYYEMDGVPDDTDMEGLDNDWDDLDGMTDEEYLGALGGKKNKEKKKEKKEKRKEKKEQKKTQPKKKGFFKKIGEAVKKGGKAFIRYNPLTISARNGFLLALKMNIKKMSSRLKWGYATKEQAAAKGISAEAWTKSKEALAKVEKLYADKLQGKRDKMMNAILKGKAGGLSGIEEDREYSLSELGAAPAATALVAAVPVIAAALKIMKESGIMDKNESEDIQADIDANVPEADRMMANDPDFKDDTGDDTKDADTDDDGDDEGGIMGWLTKNPLLALGIAGLAALGLTWAIRSNKKDKEKKGKGLSGPPKAEQQKALPKSNAKKRTRKSKIEQIRLS